MTSLNLGLIGNCQISSLIDERATMVWSCLPQLDSDPVFCRLLRGDDEKELPGFFEIDLVGFSRSEQHYQTNTAILTTILYDQNGGAVKITDLAPRYEYVGRIFTPMMLLRRIEPLSGSPRIRIRLQPARDFVGKLIAFLAATRLFRSSFMMSQPKELRTKSTNSCALNPTPAPTYRAWSRISRSGIHGLG